VLKTITRPYFRTLLVNVDPKLGPLQDNGGPTFTRALLPGGPAIDAVRIEKCTDSNANAITTDQRGVARPQGVACDIGAYEVKAARVAPTLPSVTISGTVTLQGRTATFPSGVGHRIATVTLNPGGAAGTVNADGSFTIPNVVAGTYTLTASAPGYVSRERPNVVVGASPVTAPAVQLRCGLVTNDNFVNINDITATVASFGKTLANRVDALGRFVDQNGDGFVNINDITCVVSSFGTTSPLPWE
jgi:hypothetical protein